MGVLSKILMTQKNQNKRNIYFVLIVACRYFFCWLLGQFMYNPVTPVGQVILFICNRPAHLLIIAQEYIN